MKKVKKILGYVAIGLVGLIAGLTIKGYTAGIRYDSDHGFYDKDECRKTISYIVTKNPKHLKYKHDHLDLRGIYERMSDCTN